MLIRQHLYIYIDIFRMPDQTYVDSFGTVQSVAGITWAPGNPDYGTDYCMGLGFQEVILYWDIPCDFSGADLYEIMCLF